MRKKIVYLLLCLLASMQAYGQKVDGIYYYLSNTTATAGVMYGEEYYVGDIVIPSTVIYDGMTYDVTTIFDFAFEGCSSLTAVSIPPSVTNIGSYAFQNCTNLVSIDIPASVTRIGWSAFWGCSNLSSITIHNDVINIGFAAFGGTRWYDDQPDGFLYIGNINILYGYKGTMPSTVPSGVVSIADRAFTGNKNFTSISLPSSVVIVGERAFEGCSNLTTFDIPESVTNIGQLAFMGCSALTSISIPESVTSIEYGTFMGCTELTSIDIPSSVTYIGGNVFDGTLWYENQPDGLIYINDVLYKYKGTMPADTNIDVRNGVVCIAGWAFSHCSGLSSISIPESVESIGDYAFYGCSGLTSIDIPANVTRIEKIAFYSCSSLTSIINRNPVPVDIMSDVFGGGGVDVSACMLIVPASAVADYQNTNVWKNFNIVGGYMVDVSIDNSTHGIVEGANFYKENDIVEVKATANDGYEFINWTKNGVEISTNNSYVFTVMEDVELVANFKEAITTVVETIKVPAVNVYPNPTTNIVYVEPKSNVKVYNALGMLLQSTINNEVNLSAYPQGLYLLQINEDWIKVIKK